MSASEDRLNAHLIFQPSKRKPTCPNCIFVSFRNSWGKEKVLNVCKYGSGLKTVWCHLRKKAHSRRLLFVCFFGCPES